MYRNEDALVLKLYVADNCFTHILFRMLHSTSCLRSSRLIADHVFQSKSCISASWSITELFAVCDRSIASTWSLASERLAQAVPATGNISLVAGDLSDVVSAVTPVRQRLIRGSSYISNFDLRVNYLEEKTHQYLTVKNHKTIFY